MKKLLFVKKLLLVLLSVGYLAGCDSSTSPDGTDLSPNWTMPEAGSKYRFQIITTDSLFRDGADVSVESSDETADLMILATNIPFLGRDRTLRYGWSNSSGQYHITFEENGDTGYGNSLKNFEIYPTGKKGLTIIPTIDTIESGMQLVTTGYYENHGWEKITLAGQQYNAIRVHKHTDFTMTPEGSGEAMRATTVGITQWFVPSMGFTMKTIRNTVDDANGIVTRSSRTQEMVDIL